MDENDELEFGDMTIAEGDPNERAIGITFETAIAILRQRDKTSGDALALYCFYCLTARKQRHGDVIHATVTYCARGLGWPEARVRRARGWLEQLQLAEQIAVRGEGNRIVAHRIKVRYLLAGRSTIAVFQRLEKPKAGKLGTIEDKRTESKTSKKKKREWEPSVDFIDDEVQAEWTAFQTMRRQAGKPMTEIARGRAVAKLSKWNKATQLRALKSAIEGQWQGIYEPKVPSIRGGIPAKPEPDEIDRAMERGREALRKQREQQNQ